MEVFHPVSIDSLIDGCSDIVQYAYRYFNIEYTKPMKLWSKLLIIGKNNIMVLLELCLCTALPNATLEKVFQSFESGEDPAKIYIISRDFKFHHKNKNERFKFRRIQPRLSQQMCRFLV